MRNMRVQSIYTCYIYIYIHINMYIHNIVTLIELVLKKEPPHNERDYEGLKSRVNDLQIYV